MTNLDTNLALAKELHLIEDALSVHTDALSLPVPSRPQWQMVSEYLDSQDGYRFVTQNISDSCQLKFWSLWLDLDVEAPNRISV